MTPSLPRDSDYGRTYSLPSCPELGRQHPPLSTWPTRNLITGNCPACGCFDETSSKAGRVLRARQIIDERGGHA